MRRPLKFAAAAFLLSLGADARAQIYSQQPSSPEPPKTNHERPHHSDVEWLWQYSPSPERANGNENELIQDPRFMPLLEDNLNAPQSFWGVQGAKYKPLPDTILDFLSVPGKVLADDNRYLSITGCVFHFCPSRGLLWVDLNPAPKHSEGPEHLIVFAAIDWIRDSKPTTDLAAEYTLWLFPNRSFGTSGAPNPIPQALLRSISRFTREPLAGSGIVENITHAIVVDPDGAPHQVPIASLGIASPTKQSEMEKK